VKVQPFLQQLDHDRIVRAIRAAESRSRGEIRVHVSGREVDDPEKAAAARFEKLGMAATVERNGVLIYVAPRSRRFAVIGDAGIHQRCGEPFWRELVEAIGREFRRGQFTEGLVNAIGRAGDALATHFPRREGVADSNELADDVTED
jgi:uncharacterized membrane protein